MLDLSSAASDPASLTGGASLPSSLSSFISARTAALSRRYQHLLDKSTPFGHWLHKRWRRRGYGEDGAGYGVAGEPEQLQQQQAGDFPITSGHGLHKRRRRRGYGEEGAGSGVAGEPEQQPQQQEGYFPIRSGRGLHKRRRRRGYGEEGIAPDLESPESWSNTTTTSSKLTRMGREKFSITMH